MTRDHQLDLRTLSDDAGERLDQQRHVFVGLPLTQVEEIGWFDAKVPLPGRLGRRVAHSGEPFAGGLPDRCDASGG